MDGTPVRIETDRSATRAIHPDIQTHNGRERFLKTMRSEVDVTLTALSNIKEPDWNSQDPKDPKQLKEFLSHLDVMEDLLNFRQNAIYEEFNPDRQDDEKWTNVLSGIEARFKQEFHPVILNKSRREAKAEESERRREHAPTQTSNTEETKV